jgi:hypothetical protein
VSTSSDIQQRGTVSGMRRVEIESMRVGHLVVATICIRGVSDMGIDISRDPDAGNTI